jgi:hypothetical protein
VVERSGDEDVDEEEDEDTDEEGDEEEDMDVDEEDVNMEPTDAGGKRPSQETPLQPLSPLTSSSSSSSSTPARPSQNLLYKVDKGKQREELPSPVPTSHVTSQGQQRLQPLQSSSSPLSTTTSVTGSREGPVNIDKRKQHEDSRGDASVEEWPASLAAVLRQQGKRRVVMSESEAESEDSMSSRQITSLPQHGENLYLV